EITGTDEETDIFERGVQGTVDMLPKFDRYGYSLYSLSPNPGLRNHFNIANPFYHHSHVILLRTLHELSGRRVFRQYADQWEAHCNGFFDTAWTMLYLMFKDVMRVVKKF
ncbi:MAG: D-glucuronyl C5-epimerase family protein, partial [bacterium]